MKTMRNIMKLIGAVALLSVPSVAIAQDTKNLSVSATVAGSCTMTVAPTLAFGSYDAVGTHSGTNHLDISSNLSVLCGAGTVVRINMGDGLNPVAAGGIRQMANGTERLQYEIYSVGFGDTRWGNTLTTDVDYTGVGGSAVLIPFYGRVFAAQNTVPAGSYADTVVVDIVL